MGAKATVQIIARTAQINNTPNQQNNEDITNRRIQQCTLDTG